MPDRFDNMLAASFLWSDTLLFRFPQCVTAGDIKVCVKTKNSAGEYAVSGASVQCWDEDLDGDDLMTNTFSTGPDGCAYPTYTEKPCHNGWDWPFYTNPDIYCIITKAGMYELFTNTMEDQDQNTRVDFGTVIIYPYRTGPGTANGCNLKSNSSRIGHVAEFPTEFTDQCNNHDYCYNTCSETKLSCDLEFLNMMYSECNKSWDSSNNDWCYNEALQMYNLVRSSVGDAAYNNSRRLC